MSIDFHEWAKYEFFASINFREWSIWVSPYKHNNWEIRLGFIQSKGMEDILTVTLLYFTCSSVVLTHNINNFI